MLNYIEPVFRPPSEARSLILQVTNGCSWNNCTFCEMYTAPQKKFSVKTAEQITQELQQVAASGVPVRRVFLADGDAMAMSFRRLKDVLLLIRQYLPDVQRVSSYCLPRNLKNKSVDELAELEKLGLKLMYVGCESGDDLVLGKVSKGESYQSSLVALKKIKQAGIKSSVMILNGLGGQLYSEQHAINSALLMNEIQPEYLSTLVVSFPGGVERFEEGFGGDFQPLQQLDLFKEMDMLLSTLTLEKTVFRSDHASNYLVLKGTLSRDKERLLAQVRTAIHNPDQIHLRQEWQRGL
ncbi:MAG: radical SAM protein [Porticoccus sp.]|nr:radical SAM protein [Porticoccus sp.]MBQ0808119.1 radical SAM protein [Porticoccus sp.]